MRDPFLMLEEEAESLANHMQRQLHAARRYKDALTEKLELSGQAGDVNLWQQATDFPGEMDIVVGVGDTVQEKLSFLGCYYCLQFLRMNVASVDSLRLNLISPVDRTAVERQFMVQAGANFRALSGSYMKKLLEIFLEGKSAPPFAVVGVGTRADQDDIDVGVVDDGGPGREELNEAVGLMSTEMFRYATTLHFHISEHVGKKGYSAAIPEYIKMLNKAVHDFVIISEMLGAALILGDEGIFREFRESVVARYYHRPGDDPKWHVGFLRGILGEVRSLIGRPLGRERIHPKDDGLRMIKGVLAALKVIHGVDEVNAWRIIDSLQRKLPESRPVYERLGRALSFMEVFRYVYHLVVAQEEEIFLDDEAMEANLDRVAVILGYRHVGTVRPGTHLLVDYYEHVDNVRKDVSELTGQCTDHLKETTIFFDMFDPGYPGNLAEDFARRSKFFRGTTFWRDILEMLTLDDSRLLQRYLNDLNALSPAARETVIRLLSDCADYAPGTVMAFLVILAWNRDCDGCDLLFHELHEAFREKIRTVPYAALKLIELFYRRPQLVNRYLSSAGADTAQDLSELLKAEVWDPETAVWRDKLARLVDVHGRTSRYFKRYIDRAGETYPSCLIELDNQVALRDTSRGILAAVAGEVDSASRKRRLGEFYDLEFLRIGLATLDGAPASRTDADFTEVADIYISKLFDVCRREIDQTTRFRVATHDLLAIYATGGLGREQAYDDDFDLMILLNTTHEEVRAYANRIASKMNAEIIKRGTLPHYRLADHFGHYATTLDELSTFLEGDQQDKFVDQSQLLEARMIVGTRRFESEYRTRIIERFIFSDAAAYVTSMRAEIESRHADAVARGMNSDNVKDGSGGIRDIVMLLLMYKASCRLWQPVNSKLLSAISGVERRHRGELTFLSGALEFFKNLRNAYRMAVGAEDLLRPEYLHIAAAAMGLDYADQKEAGDRLLMAYRGCTTQVAEIVTSAAERLERTARRRESS
jgi:hypothetical protein